MNDKFKDLIDSRLGTLEMNEKRKAGILKLAAEDRRGGRKKEDGRHMRRLPLCLPLAACFCLLFTIAVAAAVPALRERFFRLVSSDYEEMAVEVTGKDEEPVKTGADDSGIHVEVSRAVTDGKTLVMYINVKDEEGRFDDTVDIFDYTINGFTFINSQLIGYDGATHTAKFCLVASGGDVQEDGKLRYQISSFQTGRKEYEDFAADAGLSSLIQQEAAGMKTESSGGGGNRDMMERLRDKGKGIHVLRDDPLNVSFRDDIDFVSISNAGYLDGLLHIQTKWADSFDNHGDVYLLDEEGSRIPSVGLSFDKEGRVKENPGYRNEYIEYIYDLDGKTADTCTLRAFFVKEGEMIQGDWEMEFTVPAIEEQPLKLDGQGIAEYVEVTPVGIYLYGTELEGEDVEQILIRRKDGSSIETAARFTEREKDRKNLLLIAESPMDQSQLESIVINGVNLFGQVEEH